MGKSSAPTPADPKVTAGAQTAQNIGTAISQQAMNNVNQVTPDGSLTYNQTGTKQWSDPNTGKTYDIPTYTATQQLSEANQNIYDANNNAKYNFANLASNQSSRLDGLLSKPMNDSGLPQRGSLDNLNKTFNTDFSADRQKVEDALLDRMSPSLENDKASLESRLASQGIRIGSDAYASAMDDYSRHTNDARLSAILGAGQEQSRLAGLDQSRAAFENNVGLTKFNADNTARSQALQEVFAKRNQPINEITALMSGSQVSNPNFITPQVAQLANTDVAGIQANYDNQLMQEWQANQGLQGSIFGGLADLGAAWIER